MDSFVLEKQAATTREYSWIVAALKGMASAYTNKDLEETLEKVSSVERTKDLAVSMDLSAACEDENVYKAYCHAMSAHEISKSTHLPNGKCVRFPQSRRAKRSEAERECGNFEIF